MYQGAFVYGLMGTWVIVNPFVPVFQRVAILPLLFAGTAFTMTDAWFRYLGVKASGEDGKWNQVWEGISAGAATSAVILAILVFYFHPQITVPKI